ncbi:MAG: hypothetical protein D6763_11090, partial [Alphaproteobacteria bacterium]
SLLYLMRRCRRLMPAQEWIAMLAPGVFFFVHLMLEGYLLACGSPLALIFYCWFAWVLSRFEEVSRSATGKGGHRRILSPVSTVAYRAET